MAQGIASRLGGRGLRVTLPALVALMLGAAPAAAATLSVTQPAEDAAANVPGCPAADPCSLANALAQAALPENPGVDVVQINGPLATTLGGDRGVTLTDVDLRGSGRGAGGTSLRLDTGLLDLGPGSSLSDVSVTGASTVLHVDGGAVARRVAATTTSTAASAVEAGCCAGGDALLDDVQIATPAGGTGTGLVTDPPAGATVRATALDVRAARAVEAGGAGRLVLQSSRLSGAPCLAVTTAVVVASSLLCVADGGDPAIAVSATLDLRGATVVADRGSGVRGVRTSAGGSATIAGSIVRGFAIDLQQSAGSTLQVGTSDFHTASGALTALGANVDVDPRFADRGSGDYRLARGSPVVDAAGDTAPAPDESATDVRGLPRTDPSGRRDMGAFERQPLTAALTASPDPGSPVAPVTLDASGSTYPEAGGITAYDWDLDGDGVFETSSGMTPTLTRTFAPGSRTVHVRVTAGDGTTATAAVDVVSTAAPVARSGVLAPGRPADTTAPALTASLRRTRFAIGAGTSPFAARATRGTAIRIGLSELATVRVALARLLPGRRAHARCASPSRHTTHALACTRAVQRATFARDLPGGTSSIPFSGRIGGRALAPGRYALVLVATDLAGNASTPRTLRFTVVRG